MKYIRSKITHPTPGLTEGKQYKFIRWGFYRGPYFVIINDYGNEISIYDPKEYLHTEDIELGKSSQ